MMTFSHDGWSAGILDLSRRIMRVRSVREPDIATSDLVRRAAKHSNMRSSTKRSLVMAFVAEVIT